ncbi:hypothetical protein MKW98_026016 [Papaver atlanticum]|uniref:BHLH domain-containing protein n=1 Tax=Papaver atlanticum TaxID=357466 RepID=A0AAD4RXX3_9MAGN|nr:hypothetical protein MKW98_026016 [Papaver atlanticum]
MNGNNEPSSFMHQSENILNSISSLLVNPADSTSIPELQQVPPNEYELPSMGPDMSVNQSPLLSPGNLFEFSQTSPFQKPSTSSPPAPEVSTSSPPSNSICFGTPSSPADNNIDPTMVGFSYGNRATMGAAVVGTNKNTMLHPTDSHLNKHQQVGNTKYSRRVQNAIVKPLVAERHRRERLNQHFIALSAQIPGLKKIDRASVLEEATKYLTQLKEKVKTLEEEQKSLKMSTNTKTTRSLNETTDVATMNKKMKCDYNKQVENSKHSDDTSVNNDDDDDFGTSSCEGNYEDERLLPEIEARVSQNNMFIRIHCEKHQGVLGKVIKEIEKLHLTVLQSSVMPSGNSTLYITIISQVTIL